MSQPEGSAAEHFRRCGPMCTHVEACPECVRLHWLCPKHRPNPDGTWQWKRARPEDKTP
jgi:hypothetical protein